MNILTYTFDTSKDSIRTEISWDIWPKDSPDIIWQTSYWNELLLRTKYIEKWFYIRSGEGFAWIQKRTIWLGQYGLFCVGGPIGNSTSIYQDMQDLCKQEGTIFVQVESVTPSTEYNKWYWKRFIEPSTGIIDLMQSEEDILKQMKPKGRYNIKVAKKHDVQIQTVKYTDIHTSSQKTYGQIFFELLEQTTSRNDFSQNNQKYYQELCTTLEKWNIGGLYVATKDDVVIAGSIASFTWISALYYYGASTSDNTLRKYMATYFLQWKMIQDAKQRWCLTYDFLGMSDKDGNPKYLAWVTSFKGKFGPIHTTLPASIIHIQKPLIYKLMQLIRTCKKLKK